MNKESLQNKISKIYNVSPNVNDFLNKGFDMKYSLAMEKNYKIEFTIPENIYELDFSTYYKNFIKFNSFTVFGLRLHQMEESEEFEDFYVIGRRESDLIILFKSTNEIAIFDKYNEEILYYIAKNLEMLFDLLPILIEYDKIGYLDQKYTEEIKNETLSKIKDLITEKKFYSFYKYSITGEKN
jgi:hypothetical protein